MQSDKWLRTDEQNDVLISLRQVLLQIQSAKMDTSNWKWAIIALSSAVSGALTCNLTGTMGIGALTEKKAKETIRYLEEPGREFPDQRLASPVELFSRVEGSQRRFETAGENLSDSLSQQDNFKNLFSLRNQFIHFRPTSWSIELSGLPKIFLGNMKIIEEIINDGWSFRHLDSSKQEQLSNLCSSIILELETKLSFE